MMHFLRVGGCKPDAENHISQHARARAVTHFRRSGNSAPPAARRRSKAAAQTAASDRRPADGAGAGRRGPRASERAGGLAPPLPALPGDLQGPSGGGGGGGAMFVQEEKIFADKVVRLHICAFDGAEWLEEATEDTSVEQLKERCLKQVRPARPRPPPSAPSPASPPRPPRLSVPPSRVPPTAREAGADPDTEPRRGRAPRAGPGVPAPSCLVSGRFLSSQQLPEPGRSPRTAGGRPGCPAGPTPRRGVRGGRGVP